MAFIDCLTSVPKKINADICIVGAGAVGLSMAIKLMEEKNIKVALIESGGEEQTPDAVKLNDIKYGPLNLVNPPTVSRMRMLGGSTNCWGGWCRPISRNVFKKWPISYDDMIRHRGEADEVLHIKPGDFDDLSNWYKHEKQGPLMNNKDFIFHVRQVKNIRLWTEYKDRVKAAPNINTLYNLSAYNFVTNSDTGSIDKLVCKNLKGDTVSVEAKDYVLAAGGLENPLLMQNSDRLNNEFFSKRTQAIGRYYSDHVEVPMRYLPISGFVPEFKEFHFNKKGVKFYHWVRMHMSLNPEKYPEFAEVPHAYGSNFHTKYKLPENGKVTSIHYNNKPDLVDQLCGRDPSSFIKDEGGDLLYASTPQRNNRLTLTDEKNALGHNVGKITLNVSKSEQEMFNSLVKAVESALRKSKYVRADLAKRLKQGQFVKDDRSEIDNGRHHMGGTRMSINPSTGVVDTDLKVHGTKNLYVAGPGVFPYFDWHGPTYSAVMLGMRLKNHLLKKNSLIS